MLHHCVMKSRINNCNTGEITSSMDKTSIVEIFLENVTYTPSSLTDLLGFFVFTLYCPITDKS